MELAIEGLAKGLLIIHEGIELGSPLLVDVLIPTLPARVNARARLLDERLNASAFVLCAYEDSAHRGHHDRVRDSRDHERQIKLVDHMGV